MTTKARLASAIARVLSILFGDAIELPAHDELHFLFDIVVSLGLATIERIGDLDVFAITDRGRAALARA